MGKSKKGNKIVANFRSTQTLEDQITDGRVAKAKNKKKEKIQLRDEQEEFIDPKTTQRILAAAQKQRAELAKEFGPTPGEAKSRGLYDAKKHAINSDDEEESEVDNDGDDDREEYTEHDFFDDLKMNDEDERALELFQNK
jgi:essential nuclear protein 1